MRNLLLRLMYDGTAYHGWQVQPNGITVQEKVQDAVEHILGKRENVSGCSRTDSGVHANDFCCNIRTENPIDCYRLVAAMNAVLPDDICVKSVSEVREDFHARYDCIGKEYIYKIWNGKERNPFLVNYAVHFPRKIDETLLNKEAKAFIGKHDFAAFCASGSTVQSTVRTVYDCAVQRDGDMVIFRVKGDGFLYNMVRIMVGTFLDINDGKIERDTLSDIISSKDRNKAGITAKPQGLYLNKVYYDKGGILSD